MYMHVHVHTYICVYIYTHTYVDIISSVKFFIKNKSFKAYIPTNSLYSSALHWIAKCLGDFILLREHVVYYIYMYMYVCACVYTHTRTHTHTIYTALNSTHLLCGQWQRMKKWACFPITEEKEKWVWVSENRKMVKWGGWLRPAFLQEDFWKRWVKALERRERRGGKGRGANSATQLLESGAWGHRSITRQV